MNIDHKEPPLSSNLHIEQPEALMQLADAYADASFDQGLHKRTLDDAPENARSVLAAAIYRLHTYCQDLESQVILDCMTHVQNPAENEHVAGDMSKNEEELNMSAQQPSAWVPLPGTLPEPGKPVLLDIGEEYPIRAVWAAKHTLEVGLEDDSGFGEYNENTDEWYCPEGWYEWNEHEDVHWHVDKTPVAWCELPHTAHTGSGKGE